MNITLNEKAQAALSNYAAAHADYVRNANDKDAARWWEECRSYAAEFAAAVVQSNVLDESCAVDSRIAKLEAENKVLRNRNSVLRSSVDYYERNLRANEVTA